MKPSTKPPKPEFDTLQESDKIANAGMPDELAKAIVVALQNAQANLVSTERLEGDIDKVFAKFDKSMAKRSADAEHRFQAAMAEARRIHREDMAATEARWREDRAAEEQRRQKDRAAEEKRHSENRAADEQRRREEQQRHKEDMAARDKQHREDQQQRAKDSDRAHRTLSWFLGIIGTALGIIGVVVAVLGVLKIFG